MAAAAPEFLEAPLVMPEDLHEAMNEQSKEYLSRELGVPYLAWSRAMELQACSRARAIITNRPRYLGRG
eukprot:7839968-Pyramimonas_sp.AAC.1